jgi:hypothetical protein
MGELLVMNGLQLVQVQILGQMLALEAILGLKFNQVKTHGYDKADI